MSRLPTSRRRVLKGLGTAGIVAGSAGAGIVSLTGSGAAATVNIDAGDPGKVSNDRGDLSKVTIDPSFTVEWSGFDTAVGKVMTLIEARTREDGVWQTENPVTGDAWIPIFRATPWLTEDMQQNGGPHIDYSKPGTTGHLQYDSLGQGIAYGARVRESSNTPQARPIEVVNEIGLPDYESETFPDEPGVDTASYLEGDSLGTAKQTYDVIGDQIVNNFPGTDAGYYGAAIDTGHFDEDEDGATDADTVELRYTFAFYTVNWPLKSWYVGDAVGEGWMEHVRDSDLQVDDQGRSHLVMDGEDGYPSVTDHPDVTSHASNHYEALRDMAGSHPSVISTTTSFAVETMNEVADAGATGSTGSDAEGSGQ